MKVERDFHAQEPLERSLGLSLLRGWRGRCPQCGGGPLLHGYLKTRSACAACGEDLSPARADDIPAWATILIVGKLLVAGLISVELAWGPPVWVHWAIWPALTLGVTLWLLPRIKGMVIALQWAWRMHGFGDAS